MTLRAAVARSGASGLLACAAACAPANDTVFLTLGFEPSAPFEVAEGTGALELSVRLNQEPDQDLIADYSLVSSDARNSCATPDFELAEGRLQFPSGSSEATINVFIGDDELAEVDERFELEVRLLGAPIPASTRIGVVILDDDRTALVAAEDFGLRPSLERDQAPELQAALDAAAVSGRGVVTVAPGDYEVSEVVMTPGTTLSAHGARFRRPAESSETAITLRIEHSGGEDSAPSLVAGLSIDGRREEQGPYRDQERNEAHLIALVGDSQQGGRVRAEVERVTLESGTASGLWVGSDSDVAVCGLDASSLWRDAVTAAGGATELRLEDVDATATEGTGLWIGPRIPGYEGTLVQQVQVDNVRIGAGDVELDTSAGSSLAIRGLTMTRPPFRLEAPDGMVTITDSVLMTGLSSAAHNFVGRAHDVRITDSTLVLWETANGEETTESDRTMAAITLSTDSRTIAPPSSEPGRLTFERCSFELAANVEADDTVYAVESVLEDVTVEVQSSTLGPGYADWFSPACAVCNLLP